MDNKNRENELIFEQVLLRKIKQIVKNETSFETLFNLIVLPVLEKHVIGIRKTGSKIIEI